MDLRDNYIIPVTHISAFTSSTKLSDSSTNFKNIFSMFNTLPFLKMDVAISAIHGFEKAKLFPYSFADSIFWTVSFSKRFKEPIYTLNKKSRLSYNKFKDITVFILGE